jgi:hypothetical protein
MTSMVLTRKRPTTIALEPAMDRLLSRAAEERGVSRAEFIRQQLALVLEQYRDHPRPKSAGTARRLHERVLHERGLHERGDEAELFAHPRRARTAR